MLPRHPVYHALLWRWGISVSQRQLLNAALMKKLNKHLANLSEETTEALLCVDINYRKVFQPERVQQAASIAQQRRNKHSENSRKHFYAEANQTHIHCPSKVL